MEVAVFMLLYSIECWHWPQSMLGVKVSSHRKGLVSRVYVVDVSGGQVEIETLVVCWI